jgi:hypothetical protein
VAKGLFWYFRSVPGTIGTGTYLVQCTVATGSGNTYSTGSLLATRSQ